MPQKHKIRFTGASKPPVCGGKYRYGSRDQANQVKTEQEIMQPELRLSVYHCLDCRGFHLTRRQNTTI